jgi:hypothetical protein
VSVHWHHLVVSQRHVQCTTLVVAALLLVPVGGASARTQSQRAVALATARAMTPRQIERYEQREHVEAFGSYRITVPKSWSVVEPGTAPCDWPPPGTPQLMKVFKPNVPACGAATRAPVTNDGVILYWPGSEPPETASPKWPRLTLRPRTNAPSKVFALPGNPNVLVVKFREGAQTFQVTVAVGRDGRVAGRVIASMLWNPDTS